MKRFFLWIMVVVVATAIMFVCDRIVTTPSIFLRNDAIAEVSQYLDAHPEYNQDLALMVDFSRLSMLDRMYVVDMRLCIAVGQHMEREEEAHLSHLSLAMRKGAYVHRWDFIRLLNKGRCAMAGTAFVWMD